MFRAPDLKRSVQRSPLVRILLLVILGLVLQIPIVAIENTISERKATREQAVFSVTDTWGAVQTLAGPMLVVPVLRHYLDKDKRERTESHRAYFLPQSLKVTAAVTTERRYRGLFEVPLYETTAEVSGSFAPLAMGRLTLPGDDVRWDQAVLAVGLSDPRALRDQVELVWDGTKRPFEPGRGQADALTAGIHAELPLAGGQTSPSGKTAAAHTFAFKLRFGGSSTLAFVPAGDDSDIELTSAWQDPSFEGAYLPATRTVNDHGFKAGWHVLHLGRGYPEQWLDGEVSAQQLNSSSFGVGFLSPLDAYATTTRTVKYELLFVGLTFLVFFLLEIFHGRRIHPVQYVLVGSALCLFYLVLLGLAEHTGFNTAYLCASLAVVAINGGYCLAILGRRIAALIAGLLSGLYAFLFILMQLEDYALVVGAVSLMIVLAALMYVTRKINWYELGLRADDAAAGT